MGAWSHEPFGNDTAGDWVYQLEDALGLDFLEQTLDHALDEDEEYLEAPEAEEALAAVEVLVHLLGKGASFEKLPEDVGTWVAACTEKPSQPLVNKALRALARIGSESSELRELWEESEDFEAWKKSLNARTLALQAL
jgi:hypothetical protein